MIRLVIDDIKELSVKEATALGHMFMHLAGHTLHAAPTSIPMPPAPPLVAEPELHTAALDEEIEQNFNESVTNSNAPVALELDANGIPWDARIHARNKSQTPSGVWKLGRNLSSDFVKKVLAELKGVVPPVPMPPVAPPVPMPPVPVPTPPPVLSASDLYEDLLNRVTTGMGNNSLTIATVNNILRGFNVANLAVLGTFSDAEKLQLIPQILDEMDRIST